MDINVFDIIAIAIGFFVVITLFNLAKGVKKC